MNTFDVYSMKLYFSCSFGSVESNVLAEVARFSSSIINIPEFLQARRVFHKLPCPSVRPSILVSYFELNCEPNLDFRYNLIKGVFQFRSFLALFRLPAKCPKNQTILLKFFQQPGFELWHLNRLNLKRQGPSARVERAKKA